MTRVLAASLLLSSFLPLAAQVQSQPSDRIVVLISVDGLAHYYFDDPKAEMPTIRRLAAEGARADKMKCSMPTVTWPNHTTLVTGVHPAKHGVIGNSYFNRTTGSIVSLLPDPLFNKEEIVHSPTIYDVAKQGGLKTAAIIWPASRGAETLDWTVPDVATNALFQQYGTQTLFPEFKEVGIPYEKQEDWCKGGNGNERDVMYVQMLNHVIRKHRPNLALIHLVELDHVEHAKGPQTPEVYETVKFEDERVREIWEELQKSFPGKATLIVTSDHGFFPYQQQIQPNVVLNKQGLLTAEGKKITGGQVRAVSQGGSSFVYILDQANREKLLEQLAADFKKIEGVDLVIRPAEFEKYGLAHPKENAQMADLVLTAKSGYSFSDSLSGDLPVTPKSEEVRGAHGFDPNQLGMYGTFVAWGAGVQPGAKLGDIANTDVAPTVTSILGLKMPPTDGAVLNKVLAK
ncbi:MAG: alkaline phosphatase family protein [Verrucomicrobia bacterium]|nr:alkaline phosphatase family protein [Verrucomicrobiota bacterium]